MPTSDTFQRKSTIYVNQCDNYLIQDHLNFDQQFFKLYRKRLEAFTPLLIKAAHNQIGFDVLVRKLTDLQEGENCIVIGTIYKDQELKPNILKEIAHEANVVPQPIRSTKYTDVTDKLILEDESLRILLTGEISIDDFVTGVPVALYGCALESGTFNVFEIIYAGLPDPIDEIKSQQPGQSENSDADEYVLLLSGLSFGSQNSSDIRQPILCRMLSDWICGFAGDIQEQSTKVARITRLIIAGNSIDESLIDKNYGQMAKYLARKVVTPTVEAVRNLDSFLNHIANFVEVDFMPGQSDPVCKMMPQQPFHKCMLPQAGTFSTLHNVTNPYAAMIGNISFLGTSGQNIDDIYKLCEEENRIKLAMRTLKWRYLCPSCPDTLDCYPFSDRDPFIIDRRPDVYFIGNQPEFGYDYFDDRQHRVLVLTLPNFARTGFCALVNLKDLSVEPISFEMTTS